MIKKYKKSIKRNRRNKPHREDSPSVIAKNSSIIKSENKVYIYQSELDYISRCILDYKNIETGGQLFGFTTLAGTPVILYAIGPGPKANHQSTFFNQDIEYLEKIGKILVDEFGLQHIGEWHSHHQLGLPFPSRHDAANMRGNVERLKLPQFLLCIGVCDNTSSTLNAYPFYREETQHPEAKWIVRTVDSPFRQVIDNQLKEMLCHPNTQKGNMQGLKMVDYRPNYAKSYWLNGQSNGLSLKAMLDYVNERVDGCACVMLDDRKHVHIMANRESGILDIHFDEQFPITPPIVTINTIQINSISQWNCKDDIYQSFMEYTKHIKL